MDPSQNPRNLSRNTAIPDQPSAERQSTAPPVPQLGYGGFYTDVFQTEDLSISQTQPSNFYGQWEDSAFTEHVHLDSYVSHSNIDFHSLCVSLKIDSLADATLNSQIRRYLHHKDRRAPGTLM
jgi:hypothetical protein